MAKLKEKNIRLIKLKRFTRFAWITKQGSGTSLFENQL